MLVDSTEYLVAQLGDTVQLTCYTAVGWESDVLHYTSMDTVPVTPEIPASESDEIITLGGVSYRQVNKSLQFDRLPEFLFRTFL